MGGSLGEGDVTLQGEGKLEGRCPKQRMPTAWGPRRFGNTATHGPPLGNSRRLESCGGRGEGECLLTLGLELSQRGESERP